MRIDIITIFPGMFAPVLNESMVKRAQDKGKVKICVHNLRDYSLDKHSKVDDRPFGGGSGMVVCAEPIFRAVDYIKSKVKSKKAKVHCKPTVTFAFLLLPFYFSIKWRRKDTSMATITLDRVLTEAQALSAEEQAMLEDLLHKRRVEYWRKETAAAARQAVKDFRAGKLKAQPAKEVIAALRSNLKAD